MYFAVFADHRVKLKESERRINTSPELGSWDCGTMKVTFIPVVIDALGTDTIGLVKGVEDFERRGQVKPIQINGIIEIGQNTENSPGDLGRLAVIQPLIKRPSTNANVKNSLGVSKVNKVDDLSGKRP